MSFIFGGDTGTSYDDLKRKRALAARLMQQNNSRAPKNVGEGIHAIARGLVARGVGKQADKIIKENPQYANIDGLRALAGTPASKEVINALMSGVPNFARGGVMPYSGQAVVGENGPEVVNLPKGAQVVPNGSGRPFRPGNEEDDAPEWFRKMSPEHQQEFLKLPLEQKQKVKDSLQEPAPQIEYESPKEWLNQLDPSGPQGFNAPQGGNSFIPGAEYQTADMSGVGTSGVGETNQLNAAARSFQGLMKSMQDYEEMYKDGGSTMWPGERKDKLDTAHRDLQMQMKELYNLGVLNGPDLDLMNQILLSPTSISGNIMDAVGISDMEKRIPSNINEVRRMMINRTTPALQQLGIDPESLMPPPKDKPKPEELSDEDLLKMLTGG